MCVQEDRGKEGERRRGGRREGRERGRGREGEGEREREREMHTDDMNNREWYK